jgi:GDP-4-dehydro-6-deoxy-D-mannose reductase
VIHLAGLTRGTLEDAIRVNAVGTYNLLDSIYKVNRNCDVLVVSSAAVYGYAGEDPIPETTPMIPLSPYGISKAAQELVATMYSGPPYYMDIDIARTFNIVGPGQPSSFVCGSIAQQAVSKKEISVNNIYTIRDFIDVRDVVKAYWAICTSSIEGVFNIGSGKYHSVMSVIHMVNDIMDCQFKVNDGGKSDIIPHQCGDIEKIKSIGWSPTISLRSSIRDMIDWEKDKYTGNTK